MKDAINWFDIAVANFDRALKFYETALDTTLEVIRKPQDVMGMFPADFEKGVGGAISFREGCKPGKGGTTVYLNVTGKLDAVLARVPAAGGKIIMPRTAIPPHGFIGIIEDSEGNSVGLHSPD
jgi:hypothetical protein